MTFEQFIKSLDDPSPPPMSLMLQSLWYDAQGDWEKAHDLISDLETPENNRIHAYLHRKEGDQWNADYWYRRAGEKRSDKSLDDEWRELVSRFLV